VSKRSVSLCGNQSSRMGICLVSRDNAISSDGRMSAILFHEAIEARSLNNGRLRTVFSENHPRETGFLGRLFLSCSRPPEVLAIYGLQKREYLVEIFNGKKRRHFAE